MDLPCGLGRLASGPGDGGAVVVDSGSRDVRRHIAGVSSGGEGDEGPLAAAVRAAQGANAEGVLRGSGQTVEGVEGVGGGEDSGGGSPVVAFHIGHLVVRRLTGVVDGHLGLAHRVVHDDRVSADGRTAADEADVADRGAGRTTRHGVDVILVVVVVNVAHLRHIARVGSKARRRSPGAVDTVDSEQDVAVAIPRERGVEYVKLFFGDFVVEVTVGKNLHEGVRRIGMDKARREIALGDIGHVDIHAGQFLATCLHIGRCEGEGRHVSTAELGHNSRVDDGLHIAVVVE